MARSRYAQPKTREGAMRMVKRGGILLGIGVAVTAGSLLVSKAFGGGFYVVSAGSLIFGFIYLFQGGMALMKMQGGQAPVPPPPGEHPSYPERPKAGKPGSESGWKPPSSNWPPPGR